MNEKNLEIVDSPIEVKKVLKNLSVQDFRNFGLHQIAYIRNSGSNNYVVYGADGQEVCRGQSLENALIKAKQENLEPVVVH